MARTPRTTGGLIAVLALAVLLGSALAAGPALAQETTDDGMGGNETMSDGDTMGNETGTMDEEETMDDGTETMEDDAMTDEGMGDGQTTDEEMTNDEQMTGDGMTEDGMGDEQMTDEETMDGGTASDGQPGFGVVVGLAALVGVAGFAIYRRRG